MPEPESKDTLESPPPESTANGENASGAGLPTFALQPPAARPELGKLQQLGRVLIFLVLMVLVAPPVVFSVAAELFGRPRGMMGPGFLLFVEAVNFALLVGVTFLLAQSGQIPWWKYGLPWADAFKGNFWVGLLLGLAEASVLIGLIEVFGGFSMEGWALQGAAIAGYGLVHFLLFVCVGLYEEFLFRGYPQFALTKVMGFWPAALLMSAGFGAVHLGNRGETFAGVASVAMVGLLFAFTLKRTGNLWYAVGLHAGFDWAQSFVYSVPDSGELIRGHLWQITLRGPDWLTGGSAGPEASVFCFLTMGLQFFVVMWLFPAKRSKEAIVEILPPAT